MVSGVLLRPGQVTVRWMTSLSLLAALLLTPFLPLFTAFAQEPECRMACSRKGGNCCCKRLKQHAHSVPGSPSAHQIEKAECPAGCRFLPPSLPVPLASLQPAPNRFPADPVASAARDSVEQHRSQRHATDPRLHQRPPPHTQ